MKPRLLAASLLFAGLLTSAPLFAGDQTQAPAKAIVQISVTDADAPDGKPLPSFAGVRGQTGPRDELSALKADAVKEGLVLTLTPRFSVTTFVGATGVVSEQTQIPYMTLNAAPGASADTIQYATVKNSLSATPHVNTDGTITVDFTLTENFVAGPAWRELGPPNIVRTSTTTKLTCHDGDTRAVYFPGANGFTANAEDIDAHRAFITVKLVPAVKG